jgi:hypothetical protein
VLRKRWASNASGNSATPVSDDQTRP